MPKPKGSYAYGSKGAGKSVSQWFWEGVNVNADPTQCWPWMRKTKAGRGYGVCKRKYAHRMAYELEHGPIGPGLLVCHKCDNPKCCNPSHLFLGTQADNMQDASGKMRLKKPTAKLNVTQIKWLRVLAAQGATYDDLVIIFQVNRASLHDAVHRKTYQWVK